MKKILVVDDREELREMVQGMLQTCGFHVEIARDGVEALKMIHLEKFDCIVTDFQMPNMNGMELAEEVKRLYPQIPMIMITGRPDLAKGALVFKIFGKPVNFSELVRTVKLVTGEPII